jgi:hypothetical protein
MDTLDALKNGVCSVCGEFGRNEELCFAVWYAWIGHMQNVAAGKQHTITNVISA